MIDKIWTPFKWIRLLCLFLWLIGPLEATEFKGVRVAISGQADRKLKEQLLKSTSIPYLPQGQQTWQRTQLLKAIQEEVPRWIKILHGFGYYDAQIRTRLRSASHNWIIELQISPGACYYIEDIIFEEYTSKGLQPLVLPVALKMHQKAIAETISHMEKEVLNYYRNTGYADAEISHKQIEIHPADKSVHIKWVLNRSTYYLFGPTDTMGLKLINPRIVQRKILFREGTPYNQLLVEQSQADLENTGQFNQVQLTPNWSQEKENRLPLLLSLSEVKRRSLAFGVNIATDSGFGTKFLWENRNLTGNGDLLAFRALRSDRQKKAYWLYNRPDIFESHTDLRCQIEYNDEITKGYDENDWEVGVFFDRKFHKRLKFSYGPNVQFLKTTNTFDNSYKTLLSLVTSTTWTNIDNPLKPVSGRFHQIQVSPYTTVEKNATTFLKIILKNGFYQPINDDFILGFGLQIGSILGASRRDIPPPLRFFEGGQNSFRGYAYKSVSPLTDNDSPLGGRSFLLFTLEPRWQVNQDFSLIPFYETGRVYTRGHPELLQKNLQSVGLGFSWDTIVGPVRFDVAFPLDRRQSIDSAFQLYLSIGSSL